MSCGYCLQAEHKTGTNPDQMQKQNMKINKALIATTLLIALIACDEETNPFTQTDQAPNDPERPVIDIERPVIEADGPVIEVEGPVIEVEGPTTTSGFNINSMTNGTSETDFQNFWKCSDVGETDPDAYFSMRFYSDASGAYGGGGTLIEYSWASTDYNIDMIFPNDARNLRFANISFSSNGFITTDFETTDAATSALNCELLDLDGNPVFPD